MKELEKRLSRFKSELDSFPQWADAVLGNTALSLISRRVVTKGLAPDEAPYKPYSTKPILVGAKSFRTKAAAQTVFGSPTKRKAMQWRTINRGGSNYRLAILPGGYKEIRRIEGSQVDHKSFFRSGEMWKSIHVLGTRSVGDGRFVTTVGTAVDLSNKKLEGNQEREGKEILMVSAKEEKVLTDIFDKYITNLVNRAING